MTLEELHAMMKSEAKFIERHLLPLIRRPCLPFSIRALIRISEVTIVDRILPHRGMEDQISISFRLVAILLKLHLPMADLVPLILVLLSFLLILLLVVELFVRFVTSRVTMLSIVTIE